MTGAVTSLEADGLPRPLEALSCAGTKISSSLARLVVPSAGRAGSLGQVAWSGRWFASTPTHSLAVAVQPRINPAAVPQGSGPLQSPRLPEPFLPEKCKHGIVHLALHTRAARISARCTGSGRAFI